MALYKMSIEEADAMGEILSISNPSLRVQRLTWSNPIAETGSELRFAFSVAVYLFADIRVQQIKGTAWWTCSISRIRPQNSDSG